MWGSVLTMCTVILVGCSRMLFPVARQFSFPQKSVRDLHAKASRLHLPSSFDSAMSFEFPPSSIRPILAEIAQLLSSRNETISVAETVSLPHLHNLNP